MDITVGNLRNVSDGVRCDRLSVLGNPFVLMTRIDPVMRVNVVTAYGYYLYLVAVMGFEPLIAIETVVQKFKKVGVCLVVAQNKSPSREDFMEGLHELESRVMTGEPLKLLCWCEPDPCHCDRIKAYLEWRFASEEFEPPE
jgi:Domain of unknown function (DUF4326)